MENNQVDYTFIIYWQVVKYLSMAIIFACFVMPFRDDQYIHATKSYLLLLCIFCLTSCLYYILQTMCFQEYFVDFLTAMYVSRFFSRLIILLLIPYRDFMLNCYVKSAYQAMMHISFVSLFHITAFVIIEMAELAKLEEQRNQATSFIFNLFDSGNTFTAVLMGLVYGANLLSNEYERVQIRNRLNQALRTTDPQELADLVVHQDASQNQRSMAIPQTFWSVMKTLSYDNVLLACVFLIFTEVLEIIKSEANPLMFHTIYPFEFLAYVSLFRPQRGADIPETLPEVLINEKDRKAFQVYIQQTQNGLEYFQFLTETAKLRDSGEVIKQDVYIIFQRYFNNPVQQQFLFSQNVVSKIKIKFSQLSKTRIDEFPTLFEEAQAEATEYLQQVVIPQFYQSKLGSILLTHNAFNSVQVPLHLLDSMQDQCKLGINPLIPFVDLIEKHDTSQENNLTQTELLIQQAEKFIVDHQVDYLEGQQRQVDMPDVRRKLQILKGQYLNLISYERHQNYVAAVYQKYFASVALRLDEDPEAPDAGCDVGATPVDHTPVPGKDYKEPTDMSSDEASLGIFKCFSRQQTGYINRYYVANKYLVRHSQMSQQQQLRYNNMLIKARDFLNVTRFDPIDMQNIEIVTNPLERVLLTALDLLGVIQYYDLPPQALHPLCQLITSVSSTHQYFSTTRAMMAIQILAAYVHRIQGSFCDDTFKLFSPEQATAAVLAAACVSAGHSGLEDDDVIAVKHALSIIYNDYSPNQRSSAVLGWNLVDNSKLFADIDADVLQRISGKFVNYLIQLDSKLISDIFVDVQTQLQAMRRDGDSSRGEQYTDCIMQLIVLLSVYSDSYRKQETADLLCQNYQQQFLQNMRTKVFCLQMEYSPVDESRNFIAPMYQLFIIDNVQAKGIDALFNMILQYCTTKNVEICDDFYSFSRQLSTQVEFNKHEWLQAVEGVR